MARIVFEEPKTPTHFEGIPSYYTMHPLLAGRGMGFNKTLPEIVKVYGLG